MNLRPIEPARLKELLSHGPVQFAFMKRDGSLRTAVGTTRLNVIPLQFHPKGKRPAPPSVVAFFDLEKGAWRALSVGTETFVHQ